MPKLQSRHEQDSGRIQCGGKWVCLSVFMEMKLSWRNQNTTMLFVSEM